MMARRIHRLCLLAGCALAQAALAGPAYADQFKQAADGSAIDCAVSARELTRFALIGDQFASVSKISTGAPYNDFAVTNEPLRGDIYISVPETYAARCRKRRLTIKNLDAASIDTKVAARTEARANKDFAKGDEIRKELTELSGEKKLTCEGRAIHGHAHRVQFRRHVAHSMTFGTRNRPSSTAGALRWFNSR